MNKEEIEIIVNEYLRNLEYNKIVSLKGEIKKTITDNNYLSLSTYESIVLSLFYYEDFEEVIKIVSDLSKKEIESFSLIYYALLSSMASDDYYLGLSVLNKYKMMNKEEIKAYREIDGANYLNLLHEKEDMQKALLISLFLENQKDNNDNEEAKMEIALNYFELLGSLYEMGYSNKVIKELTSIGHILFKI